MFYYEIEYSPNSGDVERFDKDFKRTFLTAIGSLDPEGFAMHKDNAAYRGNHAFDVLTVRGLLRKFWRDGKRRRQDSWFCFRGLTRSADTLEKIVLFAGPASVTRMVELSDPHYLMFKLAVKGERIECPEVRAQCEQLVDDYIDDMIAHGGYLL